MDQESDLPENVSVLKGGKRKAAGGAAANHENKGDKEKSRANVSNGDAKLSSLIHGLARHLVQKTPDLPPFPHKLHVISDIEGRPFILEEGDGGEVRRVDNDIVGHYIIKFISDNGFPLGTHKITADKVKNIITEFIATAPRIEEPAMVLAKSEPGLTYRKLPFDFEDDPDLARCPSFKEMMGRTSNCKALMAWIGSLFDPDADLQQYVWLYGDGQNGKSALGRLLSKVFGNGARSVQPPTSDNSRFWTLQLVGKRLVIYGDCNNVKFVTSGLFKSMTGGDIVPAEIKGGALLQVILNGKHLYFSNKKPGIDSGEADQRRIILCEMGPIVGEPDPFYEKRLWDEAPRFLGACISSYLDIAGPLKRIPCDQEAAKALALENDLEFDTVFTCRFVLIPGAEMEGALVQRILREEGIKGNDQIKRFKDFIRKNYDIVIKQNSHGRMTYHGMALQAAARREELPKK